MAQLRLGTTIGGYAAYHVGNLPVYATRWPTAAEVGAISTSGGTASGAIRASHLQAGAAGNAWKAMMGASGIENEGIFGVSSDGTVSWHSYLRIGRTSFQYNNGVSNYDIYHSGTTIPWDKISGGSTTTIAGAGSAGSHASITISGAKNGYAGIHFSTSGNILMMGNDVQGVHSSAGWSWYFNKGVLTVGSVPWVRLTGIPSTFTPSAHTHDDRYFTESEADGRFLGKTATATNSTNLNGVAATGYARAYSGSYDFGGNANAITTAQFLSLLAARGAFTSPVWVARGSWNYAGNQVINDTGVGNIHLAGAVIEVVGTSSEKCTIRIHQPTTTSSGTPGGDFIYVNNGPTYSPGWRKLYNTVHPPSYSDVGALAAGGTAVNSSKLGGYAPSTSGAANTIALRNAAADIDARLFRSSYANQDTITGAMAFRVNNSSDPYIRFCSSPAAVRAWLGAQAAGSYAAASHTHAGADVTALGHRISVGSSGELYANNTSYRQAGMYGIYDSSKVGHIWSMGTAYKVNAAGTNFGSLYGLAYKHTTNTTGGTMAGGHQAVWCQNGVPKCAFGDNIWSAGNVTAYSDARVKFDVERIDNASERLMKVNGYTYRRSDIEEAAKASAEATGEPLAAPKRYAGVIAQEFLEVLPEVVTGGPTENDPDGHYSVDYGNIVALLIEGFKEQQRKIEDLERLCQTLQQATR